MERIAEPTELQFQFAKKIPELMLASSSPNRKALLEIGGAKVTTYSPDIDEKRDDAHPFETIQRIAKEKMEAYLTSTSFNQNLIAIAADTLVLKDNKLLGKPKNIDDARRMLEFQSGGIQRVITSVGLYIPGKGASYFTDSAEAVFKTLTEEDIDNYLKTGESLGAAGGYRLQKTGYELIERINGDWTTIVGLPLMEILRRVSF